MITQKQFIEEFILNIKKQGFIPTSEETFQKAIKIRNEIYLDYLYQVCPQYAIFIDPKIIDESRIFGLAYGLSKAPKFKSNMGEIV